MAAQVSLIAAQAANQRITRNPQHPFQLKGVRPWQIQPMLLAPVLPGETLQNLLLQARVVSDPLVHPLIGWHCEYYFFYVKVRDLNQRDLFEQMFIDPTTDVSSLNAASDAKVYHKASSETDIPWGRLCLERVTQVYFRTQDETILQAAIDGLPLANIGKDDLTDSLGLVSDIETPADIDLTSTTAGQGDGTAKVMASEIDEVMRNYEFLRNNNLIDMSYEDFLGTYGVRPKKEESHEPELIRYIRKWTYPTNTINPADGSPSSAVSWVIAERSDKRVFCREPGFIFGVQVLRPKVYSSSQVSTLTSIMNKAMDWLPSVMADDPWSSMRAIGANEPPFSIIEEAYMLDIKDLFVRGEQFLNFDPAETEQDGAINVPRWDVGGSALIERYGSATAADTLFSGDSKTIRTDGIVSLSIKGRLVDTSPNGVGSTATT